MRWKLAAVGELSNELMNATATVAFPFGGALADAKSGPPSNASPRINNTGASRIATAHRADKSFTQFPPWKSWVTRWDNVTGR
jgi:hypothetical protein